MIGSWRWNVLAAIAVAGLIFFLAFSSNPLETTIYRVSVSFVVTFAVTYAVRWMLGQAMTPRLPESNPEEDHDASESAKGQVVNLVTPDDEPSPAPDLHQDENPASAKDEETEFSPLTPPKLVTKTENENPEKTAEVIRTMIDE